MLLFERKKRLSNIQKGFQTVLKIYSAILASRHNYGAFFKFMRFRNLIANQWTALAPLGAVSRQLSLCQSAFFDTAKDEDNCPRTLVNGHCQLLLETLGASIGRRGAN